MSDSDSSDDDCYGPALPPGFKPNAGTASSSVKNEEEVTKKPLEGAQIGPSLPPELRARLEADATTSVPHDLVEDEGDKGAVSPSHDNGSGSESDSDMIGPLPPDHPKAKLQAARATQSSSESKKPKREEWMLVPPKNRIIPGLGLEPRKFLTRTPQDSHNSDEEEDEDEAFAREADAEIERNMIAEYDKKMDEMKKDFETKKRRGESLLEIHRKDMKKKKNETSDKAERKPFDRDTDMHVSGISKADKEKYIQKSKELDSKFSRGSRKYL